MRIVRRTGLLIHQHPGEDNFSRPAAGFHRFFSQRFRLEIVGLLRIALALHFSVEETQTLLRAGRRAQLYAPVRRDAVLLFCLSRGETLELTEAVLQQRGCDSLYERL